MLREGEKAPDFILEGVTPENVVSEYSLDDLLKDGKHLVLYFYPKDNTPGCTKEACDFRDNMNRLLGKVNVAGVSSDSIKSHVSFKDRYGLNFLLLSDPKKKVIRLYKALGKKKLYGKLVEGIIRSTFIIAPDKRILKIWHKVRAEGHVDEIIAELEKLNIGE
ncbi:MAG: peroxiredoxin [Proteobacteria bacterium]|nr:peroxiredoxin [Pseudomonadota bacterium]